MKQLLLFSLALFFSTAEAQISLDFNNQPLPENWGTQGSFEIQNAAIYPKCQQNALVGSFFEPESEFWVQTNSFNNTGGTIDIHLVFGIKDLYHSLGVNSHFHKPNLLIQYAEGSSLFWTDYAEIPLTDIDQSASCIEYNTTLSPNEFTGLDTLKFRIVYRSPSQQPGSIYLLYWSVDSLRITQQDEAATPCTENLGGGIEPSFITVKINNSTFDHNTYTEPTTYYHEYPQSGNTTAILEAGQTYSLYTFTSSEAVIALWIDSDHNGAFEEDEYTELVNSLDSQNTTSLTIPANTLPGPTKMRMRSRAYGSAINTADACTTFGSGETRDYTFTITSTVTPCLTTIPAGETLASFTIGQKLVDLQVEGLNLKWYTDAALTQLVLPTTLLTNGMTYYVTQTIDCEGPALAITVSEITETPCTTPIPVGDQTQNFSEDDTLADLLVEGQNLKWYADPLLTQLLDTGTSLVEGTSYYATQTIDCESLALTVTVHRTLSLDDTSLFAQLTYSPNPVRDHLSITNKEAISEIGIYTLLGQHIKNQKDNNTEILIDLSDLAPGNYMVKIQSGGLVEIIKIIKI
ncbi:hypothetical protein D3C87_526270 [compost metagenome]